MAKIDTKRLKKRIGRSWRQRAQYSETRTVYDAGEATRLVRMGWKLVEYLTLSRWSEGYHSESISYVLGLPRPQTAPAA